MPVLAASALRPFTVRAASRSASVVRMPSDLSLDAEKAVMPSSSLSGYVMVANMKKGASGELAKPRGPRNDLAHLIRSDFVAPEPEKLARDSLNFAHAETEAHELGAHCHQAAAHKSGETIAVVCRRNRGFRARNLVDQRLNFFARTFAPEEAQDDADGLFSHSTIDAGFCGQPPQQLCQIAPP